MRRLGASAAFALALAALGPVAPARADLAPPPDSPESRRVPVTIELDWGVFAGRVSRRHVVAAGETLRTIAAKELGNAARSKAIADANPEVIKDPNVIRVGDVIWLPPVASFEKEAKPPAKPAEPAPAPSAAPGAEPAPSTLAPWYDAFLLEWAGYRGRDGLTFAARLGEGPLPEKDAKGGTVALVPHPVALAVIAALEKGPVSMKTPEFEALPRIGLGADGLVHKEDPTVKVVGKYRLTGIARNAVTADFERVRLDAEGKVVTKTWVVRPPGYYPESDGGEQGAPAPAPVGPKSPPNPPAPTIAMEAGMEAGMDAAPPPAPRIQIGMGGSIPAPATSSEQAPAPADDSRWPASTGLVVAGMGAALVAALALIRRKKQAAPPPPNDSPAA